MGITCNNNTPAPRRCCLARGWLALLLLLPLLWERVELRLQRLLLRAVHCRVDLAARRRCCSAAAAGSAYWLLCRLLLTNCLPH